MKKNLRKANKTDEIRGFTLVETLVAVTILVIGSLGPIAIAAQGIASAGYAKDQITAYYLAQEGIEFVRNTRDTNALHGLLNSSSAAPDYWLSGLTACASAAGCKVDARTSVVSACLRTCPNLTLSSGYYGYGGTTVTNFNRTIKILSTASDNTKTVQVTMNWNSRGTTRTFVLSEDLYNSY